MISVGELASAAGLSQRAVRFYVQQRLLPAPLGVGRGRHYDASHLRRLQQIAQLQSAGHSLDAIRRILAGEPEPAAPAKKARAARTANLTAQLWTRITLGEGIELQFDAGRYQPDSRGLLALRELANLVFAKNVESDQ